MKVVLTQDIKNIGKKDQVIEASDGYARNYLLPRKLAVEATAAVLNDVRGKEVSRLHRADEEAKNARELADRLSGMKIVINAKAGQTGRLFGAVTNKEIAAAIKKETEIDIDRRKIVLDSDIKNYGDYEIEVKVYSGISAKIKLSVCE